jgi:hypothetical protein
MTKEEAINYLKSSGMSDEQIRTVVDAFTCEDCISRKAVLDIVRFENKWLFDARSTNDDTDIAFNGIISKIYDLPPIQPKIKTGHWILTDDDFVYCSECEDSYYPRPIDADWYYCPHCGAKMEVNKE